jgi:hypothetical protein
MVKENEAIEKERETLNCNMQELEGAMTLLKGVRSTPKEDEQMEVCS